MLLSIICNFYFYFDTSNNFSDSRKRMNINWVNLIFVKSYCQADFSFNTVRRLKEMKNLSSIDNFLFINESRIFILLHFYFVWNILILQSISYSLMQSVMFNLICFLMAYQKTTCRYSYSSITNGTVFHFPIKEQGVFLKMPPELV